MARKRWLWALGLTVVLTGCSGGGTTSIDIRTHALLIRGSTAYRVDLLPCWHGTVTGLGLVGDHGETVWRIKADHPQVLRTVTVDVLPTGFREVSPYEQVRPSTRLTGFVTGPHANTLLLGPITEPQAKHVTRGACAGTSN